MQRAWDQQRHIFQWKAKYGGIDPSELKQLKDLVIWSAPGANCWTPERQAKHYPLAVMEWKANSATFFPYDLAQLSSLTQQAPGMLGIAVTFDARRKGVLRAARVVRGVVEEGWLEVR